MTEQVRVEVKQNWFTPLWNTIWRVCVWLFFFYVLYHTRAIIVTVLFAGTFAYVLSFLVDFILNIWHKAMPHIGSRHARRVWAVLISYIFVFFLVFVGVKSFVNPISTQVKDFIKHAPEYKVKWDNWYIDSVSKETRQIIKRYTQDMFGTTEVDTPPVSPDNPTTTDKPNPAPVPVVITNPNGNKTTSHTAAVTPKSRTVSDFGTALQPFYEVFRNVSKTISIVVESILVPILAFYFLLDGRKLKRDMFQFVPPRHIKLMARVAYETNHIMRSYVQSQALLCLIAGIITWGLLQGLGAGFHSGVAKYAVMLGIYAAFTRAIPVLGPLIGGIPITVIAALSAGSAQIGVIVAILFTMMHFAESKFIMPMIVGEKLNLHAVWVILSLLIGAEFFGLIGMFFAAPVTAIVRNIWRYYYLPRKCIEPAQ